MQQNPHNRPLRGLGRELLSGQTGQSRYFPTLQRGFRIVVICGWHRIEPNRLCLLKFSDVTIYFESSGRSTYRPKAKPYKKPVSETFTYKAGRSITAPSTQPKTLQSGTAGRDKAFDAATAHPVARSRVLVGPAHVTDGDTITIQKTQVRLFGIDAPELHHPYGKKAKWAMVRLCKGHHIRAEITEEDEYGRTVAKCFLPDGRDLSEELVKQGLAIDWPKFSGGKYSHLEVTGIRKKLWLADARQKGRVHVWERFDARQKAEGKGR